MEIKNAQIVCFSPTGTSRRIARAVAEGAGAEDIRLADLTRTPNIPEIARQTLTVIAVPVYGGHVAPLALKRMETLRSHGSPAILCVVYGNRDYEKALAELDRFATAAGFVTAGAGTFIGEHSYSTERMPVAAGRPDERDLETARQLGRSTAEKLRAAATDAPLRAIDVGRIPKPRKPLIPTLRFIGMVLRLRRSGKPMPKAPEVSPQRCTLCGNCSGTCPTGAIARGDELHTDASRCIRCCACVKRCPQRARTFDTPFARILHACCRKPKKPQTLC